MDAASIGLGKRVGQGSGHSGAGAQATRASTSGEYALSVQRVANPDLRGLGYSRYGFGGIGVGLRLDIRAVLTLFG